MRVGFGLLTLFPGRVGGSESNVRGLLGEFARGNGPDSVVVLANRHVMSTYGDFARGPVVLHHVRSYRPGDRSATRVMAMASARALPRLAARDVPSGLDLVHFPVTVPVPDTGLPEVVTLYDVQHHDLPWFFSRAERAFRRFAYDGAARSAAVVVTTSEYSKERVVERLRIEPERVEAVHLGIDRDRFRPDPDGDEALLARLDLPERFVVYPANLWPHKNHDRLLEALSLLPDRELALVLTGQTYGRLGALLGRARRLGVAERVRHLGHLPGEAVPALYRGATAMIFPSLYEGFGAPSLEAMACGCPVAASDRGSLPEVCGGAALSFDPESADEMAEAMSRITTDETLRRRLRVAGLKRSASFTWSVAARRHRAIYARAAATRPPPGRSKP